jgi:hypothetical protein
LNLVPRFDETQDLKHLRKATSATATSHTKGTASSLPAAE